MFLAVELFLFQDDRRHAIFEQRQAGVMGPGYDAENVHDDACGIDLILRFSGLVLNLKRMRSLKDTRGTAFGD